MDNFIVKVDNLNDSTVIFSKQIAKIYQIQNLKTSIFRFGFKSAEVEVSVSEELNSHEILISSNIIKKLKLPLSVNYNVVIVNNEIVFGPFIGISMGRTVDRLYRGLGILNGFLKHYNRINGVIFGFTTDQVDKNNLEIKGLMYNPQKDIWEKTILPYPSTIFKRKEIGQEWREYFSSLYPGKIFNYKHFDKWDAHDRLVQFPKIAEILPDTTLYSDENDIVRYLDLHKDIYVKPLKGNGGHGIFNIKRLDNGTIKIETLENGESLQWNFKEDREFKDFINDKLITGKYIIQQTLDFKVGNKTLDFRIGLDKDQSGNWKNNMFVTRISGDHSIVSNVASSGGTVSYPFDALKNIYQMDDTEAKEYEEKLISTGLKIAKRIDQSGIPLGKLALDIAIDRNKKMWLIEVNNKSPNDGLLRPLGDKDMQYEIRYTNMLYAKKLAGFDIQSNENVFSFHQDDGSEADETVRYHLYVSVRGKRKSYRRYVRDVSKSYDVVGKIKRIVNRVVEIEIEGQKSVVHKFISEIKNDEYADRIKGMAVKEIPVQNNEQKMVLLKGKK